MSISKQVKQIRNYVKDYRHPFHNQGVEIYGTDKILEQAADTIEALSTKLQAANVENGGGWIADREPDESGYYLVTYHEWSNGNFLPKFDDTYVKRLHYQNSEQFTGWNYPKCVDDRAENDMNKEVLAWQPLPEPYRP